MTKITPESAVKLQRILSKRVGRALSQEELELAYDALIGFAEALVDLSEPETKPQPKTPMKLMKRSKLLVESNEYAIV